MQTIVTLILTLQICRLQQLMQTCLFMLYQVVRLHISSTCFKMKVSMDLCCKIHLMQHKYLSKYQMIKLIADLNFS